MRIKILIRLKSQILEPQGKVIEKSLSNLGLKNLNNIRQGKLIELDIPDKLSKEERDELITSACKKLLVNEIIEEYEVLG
jgi:phosphoribosylformylglycinamidine synthase|tara:strand:+ start:69 stop:308 length:240 start_codon:yes stop_codon:yes gene_type:complete